MLRKLSIKNFVEIDVPQPFLISQNSNPIILFVILLSASKDIGKHTLYRYIVSLRKTLKRVFTCDKTHVHFQKTFASIFSAFTSILKILS